MFITKKRSVILCTGLLYLLTCELFASPTTLAQEKSILQFSKLADDYENSLFEYYPELGLLSGKSDVSLDHFMDPSQDAYTHWAEQEDHFLQQLNALDDQDLQDTAQYTTFLLLKETLEAKKASRICKEELWDVNPVFGWHNEMAVVAEKQPVGTLQYRQLALKRWQTFGKMVDKHIDNLEAGLKLGYSAPVPAVKRVLSQIHSLLNTPIEESPYFDFARRDGDKKFQGQVARLMISVINPALKKYTQYLEKKYITQARGDIGVSAIPNGLACYQAKLKQETTLDLTPTEIHTLGLQAIERIAAEVTEIGLKKYGTSDMATVFAQAKKESLFATEQDILNYNFAALERVKAKVPDWFDTMPKAEGTIKPYPAHRASTGASGEYHPSHDEGTTPGIFYINTYNPAKISRIDQEATLFHELIPGHHFQIALTYENKSLPPLNRYLLNAGFCEGWALYAERLADEMDLYQDEISRLGMLSNESLRAARLVVDTGIHAFHWSREQAIEYLKQHTALRDNIIEAEVDRYIMMPGQAAAYLLGKNEIQRLRQLAQEKLGDHFDIRQFHNQVLKNGAISLSILQNQIEAWIAQQE